MCLENMILGQHWRMPSDLWMPVVKIVPISCMEKEWNCSSPTFYQVKRLRQIKSPFTATTFLPLPRLNFKKKKIESQDKSLNFMKTLNSFDFLPIDRHI